MKLYLELSSVSRPALVRTVGEIAAVPAVGDFVHFELEGDVPGGYVASRRWTVLREEPAHGQRLVVRCWLQKDPP